MLLIVVMAILLRRRVIPTRLLATTLALVLAFDPKMRSLVEECFVNEETEEDDLGRLIVRATMPEDGWVYGMILSYGSMVEVLSPAKVRQTICDIAAAIQRKNK